MQQRNVNYTCLIINGTQVINMPKEKEIIREFKNFHRYLQVPFAIYADFEAMSLKINECNKSPDE